MTQDRADRVEGQETEPTELELSIFEAVNREREQRGLAALEWSDTLVAPARDHSRRMGEMSFFSHDDPELGNLLARLRRFGVVYRASGENLFMLRGVMVARANVTAMAIQGWLKSPGHRDVMLSTMFSESAVGVYRSRTGEVYVTQMFMTPLLRMPWRR